MFLIFSHRNAINVNGGSVIIQGSEFQMAAPQVRLSSSLFVSFLFIIFFLLFMQYFLFCYFFFSESNYFTGLLRISCHKSSDSRQSDDGTNQYNQQFKGRCADWVKCCRTLSNAIFGS